MNREKLLKYIIGSSGCLFAFASLYLAFCIYYKSFISISEYPSFKMFGTVLLSEILFLNIFTGVNHRFIFRGLFREAFKVFQIILISLSGLIIVLFWFHMIDETKRLIFGYFAVVFFITDYISRQIIKRFILIAFNKSKLSSRVLVVTEKYKARQILKQLENSFDWSKKIAGLCLESEGAALIRNQRIICSYGSLLKYVTRNNIDELFISLDEHNLALIKSDLSLIEEIGIKISISFDFELFDYMPKSFIHFEKLGAFQCISVSRNYLSYKDRFAKISLDYLGGIVGFIIFLVAFVILAPIIKIDSKGPVLFKQQRVGKNGRVFNCYKFRSMVSNAEEQKQKLMSQNEMSGLMFKMENDPRITKIGRFIRKTSLDELPQFINVLKGDMSLVGTRPPTLEEYNQYEPKHKARVSMSPGLTGLWQVSGRSNIKNFEDVVRLDMQYIDNWSIFLDIKIIFKTVVLVLLRVGAR